MYLFPGGKTTLAFEIYLSKDMSEMLWKMFVPWAPFLSENYTSRAFGLNKALQMLKVIIHMMQKEELHKELKTLSRNKN